MAPPRKAKKSKTGLASTSALGLPAQGGYIEKDATELELEEAVFGRSRAGKGSVWDDLDDVKSSNKRSRFDEPEEEEEVETGLERLRDDNLFFVDVPTASGSQSPPAFTSAFPDSNASNSDDEGSDSAVVSRTAGATTIKTVNRRKAAWHDPADEELTVSLKDVARLRKLRTLPTEDVVGGLEYETRLRRQFEKMHPVPSWATDARKKIMKRNRARELGRDNEDDDSDLDDDDDDDIDEEVDDLFRSTGAKRKNERKGLLKPGDLDIDRVRDANQVEATSGAIVEIGFHPRAQVLFSATADRRLRLFQIDGTENALLQKIHFPELPITSAAFHPSGSSVLLTGSRPFFMSYDLQSGQVIRSPRGLLTGGLGGSDRQSTGGMGGMERFKFSPTGEMLAVGGRRGYVHLVDWGNGGIGNGGQVVAQVKMNVAVKGIAWQKGGKELVTLGEDSEVYVWDVGTRKCITRWRDDGGFGANGIETDRNEKFTAVASSTGIVNVYEPSSAVTKQGAERKALKAIGNLTTAVTTMRFNHDSQLLALASKTNKDQLKIVHLPSAKIFANWPSVTTPLHQVTAVDFSKGSEYLAVGNARGKVLLYTVKHFSNSRRA